MAQSDRKESKRTEWKDDGLKINDLSFCRYHVNPQVVKGLQKKKKKDTKTNVMWSGKICQCFLLRKFYVKIQTYYICMEGDLKRLH